MAEKFSIRWFPNAWIVLAGAGKTINIDPSYAPTFLPAGDPSASLPKADLILVTHDHFDHCNAETVRAVSKTGTRVFAVESCRKALGSIAQFVKAGEELDAGGAHVRVVHSYNTPGGSSTAKFHKKGECAGYVVSIGGKAFYHAGDADFIPEMRELGPIDVAFLPIGGKFTMDLNEALAAAVAIAPKAVVPIHRLQADAGEFKRKLDAGKTGITVLTLKPGEAREI